MKNKSDSTGRVVVGGDRQVRQSELHGTVGGEGCPQLGGRGPMRIVCHHTVHTDPVRNRSSTIGVTGWVGWWQE